MNNYPLSPLDGRYANKVQNLQKIFSEFGLMKYRLQVEVEWLILLSKEKLAPNLTTETKDLLRKLYQEFSQENFLRIKEIESKTNHDVKAVEIFLGEFVETKFHAWIHFGCTSEDINSTSYALMLKAGQEILLKTWADVEQNLLEKTKQWKAVPMLSRTHGQPATPTTIGKELAVFAQRLQQVTSRLEQINFPGKFSGATGNFAAHQIAFPQTNWVKFSGILVKDVLKI
jgi:adenylosuccinate lyase